MYKKIHKDNYNLHIINTDKFKTIKVQINFKRKIKKDEITMRNFLSFLLINSSKKYKTSRDIEIETQELYNVGVSSNPFKSGNYHIMSFNLTLLNEKYTEKGMNKKSIEFMLELLFNPNIYNNKFDSEMFNIIKNNIEDDIKSIKDDPRKYSLTKLNKLISSGPLSYSSVGYINDLKKINESNLYSYYKDVIENDWIDIFIIGDFNFNITEIFDKFIPSSTRNQSSMPHFLEIKPSTYLEERKKVKFNQSQLCIGITSQDLTEFERQYVSLLYSIILGGGTNSKLFNNVREKNSLCYSISSTLTPITGMIIIEAGINSTDYNKALTLIKEELKNMRNNITDNEIKQAKEIYISSCREIGDSQSSIINQYLSKEYLNTDLMDERIRNINKVTKKDIYDLNDKLKLNKVFLLEGVAND